MEVEKGSGVVGTVVRVTIGTIAMYYLYKWLFSNNDSKGKPPKKTESGQWDNSDEYLYLVRATKQYRRALRRSIQHTQSCISPPQSLDPPTSQSSKSRKSKKQRKYRKNQRRKPTDSDWVPRDQMAYCPYCNVYLYKLTEVKAHAKEWRHLEKAPRQGWKELRPKLMESTWDYDPD